MLAGGDDRAPQMHCAAHDAMCGVIGAPVHQWQCPLLALL